MSTKGLGLTALLALSNLAWGAWTVEVPRSTFCPGDEMLSSASVGVRLDGVAVGRVVNNMVQTGPNDGLRYIFQFMDYEEPFWETGEVELCDLHLEVCDQVYVCRPAPWLPPECWLYDGSMPGPVISLTPPPFECCSEAPVAFAEPAELVFPQGDEEPVQLSFVLSNQGGGLLEGEVTEDCPAYSLPGENHFSLAAGESLEIRVEREAGAGSAPSCFIQAGGCLVVCRTDETDLATPRPASLELMAAPNPFNPATRLHVSLPQAGPVQLRVFDAQGRLVRTLSEGFRPAGEFEVLFDGAGLPSGLYLCRLESRGLQRTGKLLLLK